MKFYEISVESRGLKSKELSMTIKNEEVVFNSKGGDFWFSLELLSPLEPIEIQAHYYKGETETIERDLVSAGNPQIVSEKFKDLVEDLSPNTAQFFETESINCKLQNKYYVMHVTKAINCLDESRSIIEMPDEISDERSILKAIIDPSKVSENDHMFRLAEHTPMHFVSEVFYKEFKKRKLTGVCFELNDVEKIKALKKKIQKYEERGTEEQCLTSNPTVLSEQAFDIKESNSNFTNWIDNVLLQATKEAGYKNTKAFYFCLEETSNGYSCDLFGCKEYTPDNDDWACPEYSTIGKVTFEISTHIAGKKWTNALNYFRAAIKNYLKTGKYKDVLLEKKAIAVGFGDGDLYIEYEK